MTGMALWGKVQVSGSQDPVNFPWCSSCRGVCMLGGKFARSLMQVIHLKVDESRRTFK